MIPGPSSTPGSSSTPTTAEWNLIGKFAGVGISGDRKIPVSDAVSQQHRVPDEIKSLGYTSVKLYIDERIKLIEAHNQRPLGEEEVW